MDSKQNFSFFKIIIYPNPTSVIFGPRNNYITFIIKSTTEYFVFVS